MRTRHPLSAAAQAEFDDEQIADKGVIVQKI